MQSLAVDWLYVSLTQLSHRTVTCTFAVSRRPNSVVLNIGVPTFMLTLGMMLIYTIPVADGEIKDERINVRIP